MSTYTITEWTSMQDDAEQAGTSIPRYATKADAIDQAITPALDSDSYDIDAIFDDCFDYVAIVDEAGTQHGDGFFMQTADEAGFWTSVQDHTK